MIGRRETRRSGRAATLAIIVAFGGLTACARQEAPEEEPRRPVVDQRLLAALGLAQSYQHQADELEALGNRPGAIAKVRQVLEIPFPEGAPEAEDLRLDARGRVAELELEAGDLDAADESLALGLAEATRVSYFKARLFAVRGRVLQARAARLREAGNEDQARLVSQQAIGAFEQSIALNRRVLGLADASAPDAGPGE